MLEPEIGPATNKYMYRWDGDNDRCSRKQRNAVYAPRQKCQASILQTHDVTMGNEEETRANA